MSTIQENLASAGDILNIEEKPGHLLVPFHGILGRFANFTTMAMDLSKKRKADENGSAYPVSAYINNAAPPSILYPEDADRILEPFTKEQLIPILRAAILRHPDVLEAVRAVADADPAQRKLFVRGLGWETTTEKLREVFSAYGVIDEANTIVVTDKNSGKSKGYGFVTFVHVDAAILALKDPNKKIDGRITVSQLAAAGNSGNSRSVDVSSRKIYVGNIPFEISSERLLSHFSMYGEIEEGPLGFDKQSGKDRGFAFFVYKTEEGARAALVDPMKNIDGHQVVCKLAADNKKQKPSMGPTSGVVPGMPNPGHSQGMPAPNYGMGGYMGYGVSPNMHQPQQQAGMVHQNAGLNTNIGGPTGQGGPGYGGGYGGGATQYGGAMGRAGPGEYGVGLGGGSGYRAPPSSMGMPSSGGYSDGGNYGLQAAHPSQQNQPGAGAGPRPPAYHVVQPYY